MKNFNLSVNFFIDSSKSIKSALEQMDIAQRKLLIVIENDKFLSLLSIGDIQRAIIRKESLSLPIKDILRSDILVCHEDDSYELVKKFMLENRTECMPIIDEKGELTDIYFWEDVFGIHEKRKNIRLNLPVVIMAGGEGTRLRPLTNVLPKPLIPINEKTIVENIMEKFSAVGCNDFFISVNYKADLIRYYLSNSIYNIYNIEYFQEDKPLGTAGSMFLIKNKINSSFFVINCDILIDQDIDDIYNYHQTNQNDITIVSALKRMKIPYGTIHTEENGILSSLDEKPEFLLQINTGMYILEPHVLQQIPENSFFHITELIDLIKSTNGKVGVFPVSENSWVDIGNWDEYLKLIN